MATSSEPRRKIYLLKTNYSEFHYSYPGDDHNIFDLVSVKFVLVLPLY